MPPNPPEHDHPTANQPATTTTDTAPRESKPSLTILGHKLSEQVKDYHRGLSASMAGISESRAALVKLTDDIKALIDSQYESGREIGGVVENVQKAATTHLAHSALILAVINEVKVKNIELTAMMETCNDKIEASLRLSEQALQDRRDLTKAIVEMNKTLDRTLKELERTKDKGKKARRANQRKGKTGALEKEMGRMDISSDGEENVVDGSPTESTDGDNGTTDEDTPNPPRKEVKRPQKKQFRKTGPSQTTRPKSVTTTIPSTQEVHIPKRSKRQRSISLGAPVDESPSYVVEETPEENEPDAFSDVNRHSQRVPETVVGSNNKPGFEVEAGRPKTPPQKKDRNRKRMLAGPATQEAWEMDSTTT
ncbi:hypothetical protein TWF718_005027 [Orbilia javanica]|uniref:Uncharacterized protein n=1 Tax=Orbilia javanica TaxID=47235 RepID=A0AAN8RR21_9PEZI